MRIIKVLDELQGEKLLLPLAEAIDGVDGTALKPGLEDTLDLRHGAEPCEQGFGVVTILKAAIELFADGMGEPSYFSSSHDVTWLNFHYFGCWELLPGGSFARRVHTTALYNP